MLQRRVQVVGLLLAAALSIAAAPRSTVAKHQFQRAHPCPATEQRRGSCPGFVIDHIQPLCAGGADRPDNMQWQTKADAARKDIDEWRLCRKLRRLAPTYPNR